MGLKGMCMLLAKGENLDLPGDFFIQPAHKCYWSSAQQQAQASQGRDHQAFPAAAQRDQSQANALYFSHESPAAAGEDFLEGAIFFTDHLDQGADLLMGLIIQFVLFAKLAGQDLIGLLERLELICQRLVDLLKLVAMVSERLVSLLKHLELICQGLVSLLKLMALISE